MSSHQGVASPGLHPVFPLLAAAAAAAAAVACHQCGVRDFAPAIAPLPAWAGEWEGLGLGTATD